MTASLKKGILKNSKNGKTNTIGARKTEKSRVENGSILGTLLETDEQYTKILAVCADESSSLGKLRPLMVLLEYSCHGVPWFIVTSVLLLSVHLPWHVELLVNLLWGKLNTY